jgi:hypothetical protein
LAEARTIRGRVVTIARCEIVLHKVTADWTNGATPLTIWTAWVGEQPLRHTAFTKWALIEWLNSVRGTEAIEAIREPAQMVEDPRDDQYTVSVKSALTRDPNWVEGMPIPEHKGNRT